MGSSATPVAFKTRLLTGNPGPAVEPSLPHVLRPPGYGIGREAFRPGSLVRAKEGCVHHAYPRPKGQSTAFRLRVHRPCCCPTSRAQGAYNPEGDPVRLRPQKRIAVAQPTRVLVRRPRFRRAVVTGCGAAIALVVGSSVVPRHAHTVAGRALLDVPALVFLVLVVLCARKRGGARRPR